MMYVGDYVPGSTVRIPWNTHDAKGGSATRAVNGTVRIYKDSSTTERASSAGITDSEDWDGFAGMHYLLIDLSNNTDAGFYAAQHDYVVAVTGQTVSGQPVNVFLASFSIANRRAAGVLGYTAFANFQFRMMSAAGTPVTGKTNSDFSKKKYSIAGGAFGTLSGTITEDSGGEGFYLISLAAAELSGKSVSLVFGCTGAVDTPLTLILSP